MSARIIATGPQHAFYGFCTPLTTRIATKLLVDNPWAGTVTSLDDSTPMSWVPVDYDGHGFTLVQTHMGIWTLYWVPTLRFGKWCVLQSEPLPGLVDAIRDADAHEEYEGGFSLLLKGLREDYTEEEIAADLARDIYL